MIGVFDSGIGGLSVLLELEKLAPGAKTIYLADSQNFPFGEKTQEKLERITIVATKRLQSLGARTIVVACNSATVSVIDRLRSDFPGLNFVGVEPAVKLGEKVTRSGRIGLLATKKTVVTHKSDSLVGEVQIFRHHAPKLIDKIENDYLHITDTDLIDAIAPLLLQKVDTIVLGCTHFYFVRERYEKLFPDLQFVEPAVAVAKQIIHVAGNVEIGEKTYLVSGDVDNFRKFIENVVGYKDADIRKI